MLLLKINFAIHELLIIFDKQKKIDMKIEKGKLYYCISGGNVIKSAIDWTDESGDFTNKIAVHCSTKDDIAYIESHLELKNDVLKWAEIYNHNICISLDDKDWFLKGCAKQGMYKYHIITIEEFKQFYPQTETEMTPTHFAISPEEYQEWQEYKNSKKVVEFKYTLNGDKTFIISALSPNGFKNIDLICGNYTNDGLDLMFAYEDVKEFGVLYLGHYNGGNLK